MRPVPALERDIDALVAWLAAVVGFAVGVAVDELARLFLW